MSKFLHLLISFSVLFSALAFAPLRLISTTSRTNLLATTASAVIEKQHDAIAKRKDRRERHRFGDDKWEVRIFNDGINTREHIAFHLVRITGLSECKAYKTMMQAHQTGLAVVGRYPLESAELYVNALRENGIKADAISTQPKAWRFSVIELE